MKKVLVIYFSCGGVTKRIAEYMQSVESVDVWPLEAVQPYTEGDLLAANPRARVSVEAADAKCRPEFVNKDIDLAKYDTVVIGYPIWFMLPPRIIYTLLEKLNFQNKQIVPFCTSGGSPVAKSEEDLRKTFPNLNWGKGKQFSYTSAKQDVENWIRGL